MTLAPFPVPPIVRCGGSYASTVPQAVSCPSAARSNTRPPTRGSIGTVDRIGAGMDSRQRPPAREIARKKRERPRRRSANRHRLPSANRPCLSSSSIRSGVNGTLISATPSASATALAMQAGVLIALPSATPLAPSGVTGALHMPFSPFPSTARLQLAQRGLRSLEQRR